jgi:hypothetical protein
MRILKALAQASLVLLGLVLFAPGCVVEPRGGSYDRGHEPREGYYDRDHHRWYHEHGWRDCEERDEHCH